MVVEQHIDSLNFIINLYIFIRVVFVFIMKLFNYGDNS